MLGMLKLANSMKPQARTEGLSVTISDNETLVYDRELYVIHRLSAEMATIWGLADGSRDLAAIAAETGVRNVDQAVSHLTAMGLIYGEPGRKSLWTRRHILGSAAGAAAAGTFISSVAASDRVEGRFCGYEYKMTSDVCSLPGGNTGLWQCDTGIWNPDIGKNEYSWHCR